jgi:monoamine oxidase
MSELLTRRQLLAGIAAGGGLPLLSACVGSQAAQAAAGLRGTTTTEVAVIGAGYAGLACARALAQAGRDVLILEARDRVGGRCLNQRLPAPYDQYVVEGGAEFIGPTQDRMYALAQEFGIATFPAYNTGKTVNYANGRRTTYSGRIPPGDPVAAAEGALAILRLDQMAQQIPPDAPWSAPKAAEWDAQTFQTWMDDNLIGAGTKNLLRLAIIALFSAEPRELSLLYVLFYIRSAGNLNLLLDTQGGAQQDRIVGGSQAIALALAQQLGERIRFNAPVSAIAQDASGITIDGAGFSVRAQHAVVAMSPWMAGRLHYAPLDGPTQARLQLMQRMPMGSIWKVHCVYPTPFWRDAGLNGQVTSDSFLPKVTFDNTPPAAGAPGVMMGFIDGQDAREALAMTPEARRQAVIQAFVTYFGNQAADPLAYLEMNWQAEDYSGGGPTGTLPPGALTAYTTALRAPIGRLHWAGTETSEIWTGYMDGAVRSGERAAQEVLAAL